MSSVSITFNDDQGVAFYETTVTVVDASDCDELQDALSAAYQDAEQWVWEQGNEGEHDYTCEEPEVEPEFGQLPARLEIADRFYQAARTAYAGYSIPKFFITDPGFNPRIYSYSGYDEVSLPEFYD